MGTRKRPPAPDPDEITSYQWWIISQALDDALTHWWVKYPGPPLIAEVRKLIPLARERFWRAERREQSEAAPVAEPLDESPF